MFYLKESEISGGPYDTVEVSKDLHSLKRVADKRFIITQRRWVITDKKDNIITYCDDIVDLMEDMENLKKKNKKSTILCTDIYVQRLLEKEKINYKTPDQFVKRIKFLYGKKSV